MNTYDPAERICYVHLDRGDGPDATPVEIGTRCTTLPPGYANRSPGTYLGRARLRGPALPPEGPPANHLGRAAHLPFPEPAAPAGGRSVG